MKDFEGFRESSRKRREETSRHKESYAHNESQRRFTDVFNYKNDK
jgi:hypothetical protein